MTTAQFNDEYKNNFNSLMNFAKKLTKNKNEAQELVQETAMKAFKGKHTFKPGTSFKSWAFTILKNSFITKYNRRKRKNIVNKPIEDLSFALTTSYSVRNDATSRIRIKEIHNCINTLSYKSKLPFVMFVEGYQYNEISESLNIPMGTVKSRINYARKKLKDIMRDRGLIAA